MLFFYFYISGGILIVFQLDKMYQLPCIGLLLRICVLCLSEEVRQKHIQNGRRPQSPFYIYGQKVSDWSIRKSNFNPDKWNPTRNLEEHEYNSP